MNFQIPYRTVICGEEYRVEGWRGRELITDRGSFFVRHIYGDWQIQTQRILEVATIQSVGKGGWLVNGKDLSSILPLPMGARLSAIPNDENLRVYKDKICAVAWLQTQNSDELTNLLDLISSFWKLPPELKGDHPKEEFDWPQALSKLAMSFHDISTYQRVFTPQWSRPIWLTEFRPAGQEIPLSPEAKKLVETNTKLEEMKLQLQKAESAANANLEEALSKWFRFDPPGMAADTKARIEKAVKMYYSGPAMRSLAKIAAEFGVSRKTVSVWFKTFTQETGFRVTRHRRHESLKDQFQAESEQGDEE